MANPYIPPGVYINETSSPSVAPLLADAADICIVGLAGSSTLSQSPLTTTDQMILTTTPQVPPTIAALNDNASLQAVLSVKDVLNPQKLYSSSDITVVVGEGPPSGTNATIKLANSTTIAANTLVAVTYTYFPANYWSPVRLFSIGDVEARFGSSWQQSTFQGQTYYTGIYSQLSMAARIAFANGAQSVICQPLFQLDSGGNPQAPGTQTGGAAGTQAQISTAVANVANWQATLNVLRPISNLNILVPVLGQDGLSVSDSAMLNIFNQAIQAHLVYMNAQQQYIVAVLGEDGTLEGVGNATSGLMNVMRGTHAPSLQGYYGTQLAGQCVLINNTVFQLPTPNRPNPSGANTTINVGGQYAAAAVAGALGARPVSTSLTHKPVLGFTSITDPRAPADKNLDAAAGMFVIEQIGNSLLRCRQGITLDTSDGPEYSELSAVRSKFYMIESIRNTLDSQIIGNIIADANSPLVVRSAISAVLSILQDARAIVGFSQVQAALTNLNPTTITASFSYQAAFSVNVVNITFSLDLSSGSVTVNTSGANSAA